MKKLPLVIAILFISFSTLGQNRYEKNAQKKADEMSKVLNLSPAQTKKVYEFRIAYLLKIDKLRRANLGASDESFKNLIKPEIKDYNNKIFAFLGEDNRKKWKRYIKEKKADRS